MYGDLPYGLKLADWDQAVLTSEELVHVFKGIGVANSAPFYAVVLWVHIFQLQTVSEALRATGHDNVQVLFWHKVDARHNAPQHLFVPAIEVAVVAYHKSNAKYSEHLNMPATLAERQNLVIGPGQHKYDRDSNDKPINIHQKPAWLSELIGGWYAKTGAHVVVLGSGAGGDVQGLMNLGLNVVAVEKDIAQLTAMMANLRSYQPVSQLEVVITVPEVRAAKKTLAKVEEIVVGKACSKCPPSDKPAEAMLCPSCGGVYCLVHWPSQAAPDSVCPDCVLAASAPTQESAAAPKPAEDALD